MSELDLNSSIISNKGPLYEHIGFLINDILSIQWLNLLITSVILLYNASVLNKMLIRNSAFNENTYVPAALYIILSCFHETSYLLNAQLFATSFILIGLNFLLQHIRFRSSDAIVLSLGFCIGLAMLFYIPNFWTLILVLLLFIFYSSTIGRRYILLLWGFLLSLLLAWLPYFYMNESEFLWENLISSAFSFEFGQSNLIILSLTLGVPLLISLGVLFNNLSGVGKTNLQITIKSVFGWLLFFGLLMTIFLSESEPFVGLIVIIPIAYLLTEKLLEIRRKWLAELLISGILIIMLALTFWQPL